MPATYEPNQAGLNSLLSRPGGVVDKYVERKTKEVAAMAIADAPRKTGKLAASIRAYREGDHWVVAVEVPYALDVVLGTRPHTIAPRNAKVLRFPTKSGTIVYTSKPVHHPGTKANPFLRHALERVIR